MICCRTRPLEFASFADSECSLNGMQDDDARSRALPTKRIIAEHGNTLSTSHVLVHSLSQMSRCTTMGTACPRTSRPQAKRWDWDKLPILFILEVVPTANSRGRRQALCCSNRYRDEDKDLLLMSEVDGL
ncbi:hypothetical protein D9613_003557 [Agrocybe pediades]|uniref:Uncharacterized protein n=1 Tax=Agrocybe pediades TaxID=84607 RepID=A0A8H4QQ36_9AGAR|nr:hypothetical protein D9613_003557 [Agrocybe pediades]